MIYIKLNEDNFEYDIYSLVKAFYPKEDVRIGIFIPLADLAGAEDGEKCVVEMTEWPDNMNNPVGRVVKRLGRPGNNDVEMQSILAEYDFPLDFPPEAEREA